MRPAPAIVAGAGFISGPPPPPGEPLPLPQPLIGVPMGQLWAKATLMLRPMIHARIASTIANVRRFFIGSSVECENWRSGRVATIDPDGSLCASAELSRSSDWRAIFGENRDPPQARRVF